MKRFLPDNVNKKVDFIPDDGTSSIVGISIDYLPQIKVIYRAKKEEKNSEEIISCAEFVEIMNFRARGKRVNFPDIKRIEFIDPLPYEEPEEEIEEEEVEVPDDNTENVDDAVAKDIFKDITIEKTSDEEHPDDDGVQLSFFDE